MKPTILRKAVILTVSCSLPEFDERIEKTPEQLIDFLNSNVKIIENVLLGSKLDFVRVNADAFQFCREAGEDQDEVLKSILKLYWEIYSRLCSDRANICNMQLGGGVFIGDVFTDGGQLLGEPQSTSVQLADFSQQHKHLLVVPISFCPASAGSQIDLSRCTVNLKATILKQVDVYAFNGASLRQFISELHKPTIATELPKNK